MKVDQAEKDRCRKAMVGKTIPTEQMAAALHVEPQTIRVGLCPARVKIVVA